MKKLNILVADDDVSIRELFPLILGPMKHTVYTAENGAKAIEIAKRHSVDVAFVDMRMPVMDGLETFRELKKIYPNIIVVLITGYADQEEIDTAIREGAIDCIPKPFNISQIREFIGKTVHIEQGKNIRILVVDDAPGVRNLFSEMGITSNHSVKTVHDAESALKLLEKERFDVTFLDVILPGMSGIELCEKINQLYPHTQVVLYTGYPDKKEVIKVKVGKGAVHALEKPFSVREIREILQVIERKLGS